MSKEILSKIFPISSSVSSSSLLFSPLLSSPLLSSLLLSPPPHLFSSSPSIQPNHLKLDGGDAHTRDRICSAYPPHARPALTSSLTYLGALPPVHACSRRGPITNKNTSANNQFCHLARKRRRGQASSSQEGQPTKETKAVGAAGFGVVDEQEAASKGKGLGRRSRREQTPALEVRVIHGRNPRRPGVLVLVLVLANLLRAAVCWNSAGSLSVLLWGIMSSRTTANGTDGEGHGDRLKERTERAAPGAGRSASLSREGTSTRSASNPWANPRRPRVLVLVLADLLPAAVCWNSVSSLFVLLWASRAVERWRMGPRDKGDGRRTEKRGGVHRDRSRLHEGQLLLELLESPVLFPPLPLELWKEMMGTMGVETTAATTGNSRDRCPLLPQLGGSYSALGAAKRRGRLLPSRGRVDGGGWLGGWAISTLKTTVAGPEKEEGMVGAWVDLALTMAAPGLAAASRKDEEMAGTELHEYKSARKETYETGSIVS
ncbi:hypothetical protein GALMADRAFT_141743 [Galerina marginata CBS 339.88]|uniref:Uncharacterized protein n=1 Tax=Galerina marginata (strain CBS 339.88) TaxID=685588 RepID=A0A067SSZ6_GALM3|nr:hypothetical protein GALMADRAFT_141743 [Galerina marginata CBS 339.88]